METIMPLMEAPPHSLHYPSAPSSPRVSNSNYFYYTSTAPTSPSWGEFSFDLTTGFDGGPQLSSADELFQGGMVRPLIANSSHFSSSSPRFLHSDEEERIGKEGEWASHVRGRNVSTAHSRSKVMARSLSPIRRDDMEYNQSLTSPSPVRKKWRLKDLFLFRSASEGRATSRGSKDPLNKYAFVKYDDNYNKTSVRKGRGTSLSSPHEKHYMKNRAASEETKKRTPLPFHQSSLFGYLRLNPAINSIGRRFSRCYSNE